MDTLPTAIENLPAKPFAKGEVILTEGGEGSAIYFLMAGTVEVRKDNVAITRIRERGAMFGEMSVLLGCPLTATVCAMSDVECRVAWEPQAFLAENPEVMFYISRILARRLESLNRYLVDVKHQLRDEVGHVGMVDEVLEALMIRHPRALPPRHDAGE